MGLVLGISVGINKSVVHAQSVNSYITTHHLKHAKIKKQIWNGFPKAKYEHGYGKPEGVVVHETADPHSTSFQEIAYEKYNMAHNRTRTFMPAWVHTFIDSSSITNISNTNYLVHGCQFPGNAKFVQFEQVEVYGAYNFAKEVNNAAYYTAYILHQYNLPCKLATAKNGWTGTIYPHYGITMKWHVTTHVDPIGYYERTGKRYFGKAYTMNDLYKLIQKYYKSMPNVSYGKFSGSAVIHSNSDITNHVPLPYNSYKKVSSSKKYLKKTVSVNLTGKLSASKTMYYRVVYKHKTLGWINGRSLSKINNGKTKVVKAPKITKIVKTPKTTVPVKRN